jgi:glycosyltransferase involved in cell wall biosynthesis
VSPHAGEVSDTLIASIVVPAHNERGRIQQLLPVLSRASSEMNVLSVVVCNGCVDGTADLAREYSNIVVAEIPEASKAKALNLGDVLAKDAFPRLYVDADVTIDLASIAALISALSVSEVLAVRPESFQITNSSNWFVRLYLRGRSIIPSSNEWALQHIEGHGVYGTNRWGRSQFEEFPEIIADDAFFDRMFDFDQKRIVDGALVGIQAPKNLRTLFRILTRVFRGTHELAGWLDSHRPDRLEGLGRPGDSVHLRPGLGFRWPSLERITGTRRPCEMILVAYVLLLRRLARWNAKWKDRGGREIRWR